MDWFCATRMGEWQYPANSTSHLYTSIKKHTPTSSTTDQQCHINHMQKFHLSNNGSSKSTRPRLRLDVKLWWWLHGLHPCSPINMWENLHEHHSWMTLLLPIQIQDKEDNLSAIIIYKIIISPQQITLHSQQNPYLLKYWTLRSVPLQLIISRTAGNCDVAFIPSNPS